MKTPQEMYDEQLKAITNIANTKWYKEIKAYFIREQEAIQKKYPEVEEKDLYRLQEKDKVIQKFLTFLNNLEDAKKVSKLTAQALSN